jgi:ribosomal peptide maturation radical SAM protein 1
MPFSYVFRPSIQIGLLKAIVRRAGFPVDDYYPSIQLADELGYELYEEIQRAPRGLNVGEWLFSVAAFGDESNREDFFAEFPDEAFRLEAAAGKDAAYLTDLRERFIPEFIERCLAHVDWGSYSVVGFTSTFQQHVASLALARRIKARFPHVKIVFGGANVDGEMGLEYVRAFDYIDYAVSGEADEVFPELLKRLAEGRETDDIVGIVARRGDSVSFIAPAEPIRDLDSLPTPDFDTYVDAARRFRLVDQAKALNDPEHEFELKAWPFEGSRGCWWGQKSHCMFCGLNGTGISYRSKSPERLRAELAELRARYGRTVFSACDNILDMKHIGELFGELADGGEGYEFFYCTKANLTREQVRTLARGGLRVIFPGIESLSTNILKLMHKGATKLHNVNVLKWSTYYGITPMWNILYGFPGEKPADYADELETLRLITHLAPLLQCNPISLDRFSPYFSDSELFPTKWQRPNVSYRYVYPPYVDMEKAAYSYDYEAAGGVLPDEAHAETQQFVQLWKGAWKSAKRPALTYRRIGPDILIDDTRNGNIRPRSYTLTGPDADIYEALDSAPRTPSQICATLSSIRAGSQIDEDSVAVACDEFCDAGLMIGEADKYLSLAMPAEPEFRWPWPQATSAAASGVAKPIEGLFSGQ